MTDESMVIALVIAVGVLVILLAKLASFLKAFAEETRYICYEMEYADSYQEYRRWRGELRCHFLCLIPFVNQKNVMRLYNRIWHRADKEKKERKDSLAPLMLPSILGIFICMICVSSMTWAWYTANVQVPKQALTAAYYEVTVNSITNPSGGTVVPVNDEYSLEEGTSYTVKLTASGTVDKCGGYCLIQNTATGEKIYTQTFEPKESIVVQFTPIVSGAYTFTGVWGSLPTGTKDYLSDTVSSAVPINDLEPSDTAEPTPTESSDQLPESSDDTYTVQSGDTMSANCKQINYDC